MLQSKKLSISLLLLLQAILSAFILIYYKGTGDAGDSVLHYLYSKYAFEHHGLFFNHWAKPLFVLLSSTFAQFGFTGIKVFNVVVMLFTSYFTYLSIVRLKIQNAIVGPLILLFSPLVFVLTFSGLTEPLFALFLILSIYLTLSQKLIPALILISFLPFIRSEGLFYLGIFALYLVLQKKWKTLPLLLTGHVLYSVAGYAFYKDLFWIFTKIPYAKMSSTYGNGNAFHFVHQMNYVVGIPIYILFWLGVFTVIWKIIKQKIQRDFFVLIFLGFFCFFIAHSIFWYMGIFNSMGLKRVLISVAPLASIIALLGFNTVTTFFQHQKIRLILQGLFVAYLIVFPFTSNPAAIKWESDFSLSTDQIMAQKVSEFVQQLPNKKRRYFYTHPYLSMVLHTDHFDEGKRLELNGEYNRLMQKGDLIIWENWFAVVECGIRKEQLDQNQNLKALYDSTALQKGRTVQFTLYECQK